MNAEQDAAEVHMLLAEAGYPRAQVLPGPNDFGGPIVTLTPSPTTGCQDVPVNAARKALMVWAESHGKADVEALFTDEHGNPTVVPPVYLADRS